MYPRQITDTKLYGLIGHPLEHSFSQRFFTDKFAQEHLEDHKYLNFEIDTLDALPALIKSNRNLVGLNVTSPYKLEVIPILQHLDESAKKAGAVNVIKFKKNGQMTGYNSDYYGFMTSLKKLLNGAGDLRALVLGSGGASGAVRAVLSDMQIPYATISRQSKTDPNLGEVITYTDLTAEIVQEHQLIINSTPVGMFPDTEAFPPIPYFGAGTSHYFYDLVYNPGVTRFLQIASLKTKNYMNGMEMLRLQAEKSWDIWQQ